MKTINEEGMSLTNTIINQNQYVLAPSLQMFFINPVNCQPLSAGTITFYRDLDRTPTGLKPVYRIGGTPTAPTFTALPNPITLDMCGIFIDPNNGDEILPYYNVLDSDGNPDLYYIVIADQFGAIIDTIEHFPSVNIQQTPTLTHANTLLPNGQFWAHIDQLNGGLIPSTNEITNIAFGGWKYRQTPGSSSVNYINFIRYNAPSNTPDQNPRYAVEVKCTIADPADSEKQIYCLVGNVNFMQGQELTMQFSAYSNDGNNHNVNFIIIKNFGAGGSISTTTVIETVVVTPQIQDFIIPFTMSSNIGKTLGTDDSDNILFTLQSPLSTTSAVLFTNIFLVPGTFNTLTYPPIDLSQDRVYSLASSISIPDYNADQIGKYVQLTSDAIDGGGLGIGYGFTYNQPTPSGTHIWSVLPAITSTTNGILDYLNENGSVYAVQMDNFLSAYPNLFNAILAGSTVGTYEYGTGVNGFSNDLNYPTLGVAPNNGYYIVWNRFDYTQPAPNPGTSGFSFTLEISAVAGIIRQVYLQTVLAGNVITPGSYYILPVNTTGPQYLQLFWMTIDGAGTKPIVGADVYTRIDLLSTDTATNVRDKLQKYANGLFQVPDLRNRFISGWNNNSGHDNPSAGNREEAQYNTFTIPVPGVDVSYITGNARDNIGSFHPELIPSIVDTTIQTGDLFFNGFIKT